MLIRLKNLIESIVYAGMKPGARSAEGAPAAKPGLLSRFLNGSAQSDPLYLTNQTFAQRAQRILLLGSPIVLVIAGALLAIYIWGPKTTNNPKPATSAEIRARVLPVFNKPFKLDTNRDLEVTEVHFEHTGEHSMVGTLHNKSDHPIVEAVVTFELADPANSQLGGVTVTEINLAPGASRTFRKPIEQTNAMYALVREVETR